MDSQIEDCEILVHVDAPALAGNDAGYRRLAEAYLAFQHDSITHIHSSHADDRREETCQRGDCFDLAERSRAMTGRGSQRDTITRTPASGSHFAEDRGQQHLQTGDFVDLSDRAYLLASQDGEQPVTDSQDLSFEGVIDNRDSPRMRIRREDTGNNEGLVIPSSLPEISSPQQSWSQPPSEIGDSYPMPAVISSVSPSRILRQWTAPYSTFSSTSFPPHSPSSPIASTPNVALDVLPPLSVNDASTHLEARRQSSPQSPRLSDHGTNAQRIVLATQPSPNPAKKRVRNTEDIENDIGDITHVTASDPSQPLRPTPAYRAESEPVLSKRSKITHEVLSSRSHLQPLNRSASDSAARRAEPPSTTLEVWPASPPVGVDDIVPDDFITEKLDKLSSQLSSRFRPQASRNIQPYERGYWLLDSTSWGSDIHIAFWEFLEPYVERGNAGWGVWCRRDEARQWVRFYCWGHVIKHIYLLLYLASGRQLKVTGAEWRDAGGELVVRVPPRAKTM